MSCTIDTGLYSEGAKRPARLHRLPTRTEFINKTSGPFVCLTGSAIGVEGQETHGLQHRELCSRVGLPPIIEYTVIMAAKYLVLFWSTTPE